MILTYYSYIVKYVSIDYGLPKLHIRKFKNRNQYQYFLNRELPEIKNMQKMFYSGKMITPK